MQSKKIELKDTDSNAPLLPYLRRLFHTLNKEICLFELPINLPCMYSVPLIEQEDFKKKIKKNEKNSSISNKNLSNENGVDLIKSLFVYRHSKEFCYIESCLDSVRISLKFFLKCEFEKKLFDQLTIFMKKNSDYLRIIRKEPIRGFDISFLITYKLLNASTKKINDNKLAGNRQMGKYDIIQFILKFVVDIDRQIQEKMLESTYFSRCYIRKLLEIVNLNILYGKESLEKHEKIANDRNNEYEQKTKDKIIDVTGNINSNNLYNKSFATSSYISDSIGKDAVVLKALKTRNRIKNLIN